MLEDGGEEEKEKLPAASIQWKCDGAHDPLSHCGPGAAPWPLGECIAPRFARVTAGDAWR